MFGRFLVSSFFFSFLCFSYTFSEYRSQIGQDKYLNEDVFNHKKNGIFVEIGAYDGVRLSNTYFFEKEMGWTGICIEPSPEVFKELKKNRSCICVQGCISDAKGSKTFLQITDGPEMLSGLVEKYDPRHLERIKRETTAENAQIALISTDCYLLGDILAENKINHVDYLSLDTEGGELEILKSINYNTIDIDTISVENNYRDPSFKTFLESKGFIMIKDLDQDEIYRNKKYIK